MKYKFMVTVEADSIGEAWSAMDDVVTICEPYGIIKWEQK